MSQSNSLPPMTEFPTAPWTLCGEMWGGIFRTASKVEVPLGTRALLGRRRIAVILFHYTDGTLRYDELIVGVPILRKMRVGLWIRDIWVSDDAALWGGREIWHVPKVAGEFIWKEDGVEIKDERGLVACISLEPRRASLPWLWFPLPIFGNLNNRWTYAIATWRGQAGRPRMTLQKVSGRITEKPNNRPTFGISSGAFRMIVRSPRS